MLAHIDQGDFLPALEFGLKLLDCDLRHGGFRFLGGCRLGDAAEGIVVDEFRDARILTADGTLGIAAGLELAEAHLQSVESHQATNQRIADAYDQLDRLDGLHDTDDAREYPEDASLGTAWNHAWWRRFRIEAAVAGTAEMRSEHGALTVEPENGAIDIRLLLEDTDIVGEIAGRKIIRPINHDVVRGDDFSRVLGSEEAVMKVDLHVGVDRLNGVFRAVDFLAADIAGAVQDLALEVREIDGIEINEANPADAGGGKVESDRGAESARSYTENAGRLDPFLPLEGDLGHDEVA